MSRTWLLGSSGESSRKHVGQQHHRKALGGDGNGSKRRIRKASITTGCDMGKSRDGTSSAYLKEALAITIPPASHRRSEAGQPSRRRAEAQPTRTLTQGYVSAEEKPAATTANDDWSSSMIMANFPTSYTQKPIPHRSRHERARNELVFINTVRSGIARGAN